MSQVSIIDIEGNHPQIPTRFDANVGFAIPLANVLEIYGDITVAGSSPVHTVGSGNNITTYVQLSQAIGATDSTKVGLSAFNSSHFSVDANGFVSLAGGGAGVDSFAMQTGLTPVVPNGAGLVTFNGAVVAAGTNPVRTDGTGANTMALEVQISQALAAADATKIGLSNFDSAAFDVDANGFVQLNGGGIAATSFDVQANTAPGTDPVVPTAAGVVTVNGAAVANHSVVLETRSRAANAYNLEIQYATSAAVTTAAKSGVAHFDSSSFSVDANGFVTLAGGTQAIDSIGVDATSGGGTNPVLPTAAGLVTVNGAVVAAGTNPIRSVSTAANVYQIQAQTSQALAAADATKIGLSNFDSSSFAVAATGFVTLSTTGAGKTITGDSGGALSPTANNWNILGLSGSKTSGSGSTLTIKSPPFSQVGATATSSLNTGEFVTAAVTRTLPASAGLADGDLFIYVCTTSNALVVQSVSAQKIRIGSLISAAAGTATSTAIGDSLTLRFNATDGFFYAVSVIGTWLVA